jgi:hypothetical protein
MKIEDQIKYCKDRIARGEDTREMKAILASLAKLSDPHVGTADQMEGSIHKQCIDLYHKFLERYGIPLIMDSREGKAMKEIIMKLKQASTQKNNEGILQSWKFILKHWERVGPFIGGQKKLSSINKNLLEILDKIRNGSGKTSTAVTEAQQLQLELAERKRNRNL